MTTNSADPPLRVLVVEDTEPIRQLVARTLRAEGWEADAAATLVEARALLAERTFDVVLLDVVLPDGSGLDLLREIVGAGLAPVLMLSSRGGEVDRVLGLELGAEDYMVKPFYPRELVSRVRVLSGRGRPRVRRVLQVDDLVVDTVARQVTLAGRSVQLTGREFDLLAHLAAAPGRVFDRAELLRDVWKSSPEWQSPRTVTEHVRRLRQKLEDDPAAPRRIVAVSGGGYRLETLPPA